MKQQNPMSAWVVTGLDGLQSMSQAGDEAVPNMQIDAMASGVSRLAPAVTEAVTPQASPTERGLNPVAEEAAAPTGIGEQSSPSASQLIALFNQQKTP